MMKTTNRFHVPTGLAALAILAVAGALPARAGDDPHHIVRAGVAWVSPNGDQAIDLDGTDINVEYDSAVGAYAEYEWRFCRWLGVPVDLGYAKPEASFKVPGAGTVSKDTKYLTGSVGLNVHFLGRGWFDMILGGFAEYATFDGPVDSVLGYGGVFGGDFSLGKSGLAIHAAIRYSLLSPDVHDVEGAKGLDELDFDPLVGQIGLAWRW